MVLCATTAHATTSAVGGASVTKGEATIDTRVGFQMNQHASRDDRLQSRIHYQYGFTDNFALRLIVSQDKRAGESMRYNDTQLEATTQWLDQADMGFDLSTRFEYAWRDDAAGADRARIRLAASTDWQKWHLRTNLFASHEVGARRTDGMGAEFRWRVAYDVGVTELGVDAFHNFGNLETTHGWENQNHQLGLVVKGKFAQGWGYETGYLHGISHDAPDHAFKLFVVRSF